MKQLKFFIFLLGIILISFASQFENSEIPTKSFILKRGLNLDRCSGNQNQFKVMYEDSTIEIKDVSLGTFLNHTEGEYVVFKSSHPKILKKNNTYLIFVTIGAVIVFCSIIIFLSDEV